jgi:hypothetical protein
MLGSSSDQPLPAIGPDWSGMLPAIALWALALYLPLSAPLARLEDSLADSSLPPALQQLALVLSSLLLALAVAVVAVLLLSWCLGPGWAGSLGLMAALGTLAFALAGSRDPEA